MQRREKKIGSSATLKLPTSCSAKTCVSQRYTATTAFGVKYHFKIEKMAKTKVAKAAAPPASVAKPPAWPQFKPPLPIVDLEPVPHAVTDKTITISSFFPRSLCKDYVSFLSSLPLVTTPGKPKRGEAVRVNDRFQVEDINFAKTLWEKTGLKEVLTDEQYTELW